MAEDGKLTINIKAITKYPRRERLINWLPWPMVTRKRGLKEFGDDVARLEFSIPKVIEVKENDVLVLRYPGRLSENAIAQIKTSFQRLWEGTGLKPKIIILEEGMTIDVMRGSEID